MPKVYSVAEIKELDDDTIVHSFKGKITKLYPPKKGESDRGPWSFQNVFLKDPDGDEIKATLKDRDELPKAFTGKDVIILSSKSEKHGWVGVKAKDDEYNGKTTRVLWITKAASITKGGSVEADESDGEEAEPEERPKHHENEKEDGDLGPEVASDNPLDAAKDYLMRRGNLMMLCWKAGLFVAQKCDGMSNAKFGVRNEDFQALVTTLFISADRAGIADALPTHPLAGFEPEGESTDPSEVGPTQEEMDAEAEPDAEPEPEPEDEKPRKPKLTGKAGKTGKRKSDDPY